MVFFHMFPYFSLEIWTKPHDFWDVACLRCFFEDHQTPWTCAVVDGGSGTSTGTNPAPGRVLVTGHAGSGALETGSFHITGAIFGKFLLIFSGNLLHGCGKSQFLIMAKSFPTATLNYRRIFGGWAKNGNFNEPQVF